MNDNTWATGAVAHEVSAELPPEEKGRHMSSNKSAFVDAGNGTHRKEYELGSPELANTDFENLSPSIVTVCDSLQNSAVVQQILGGRKVDNASIWFPTSRSTRAWEQPHTCEPIPEEDVSSRLQEIARNESMSDIHTAAKLMKPGGKLAMARIVGGDDEQTLVESLHLALEEGAVYWENMRAKIKLLLGGNRRAQRVWFIEMERSKELSERISPIDIQSYSAEEIRVAV